MTRKDFKAVAQAVSVTRQEVIRHGGNETSIRLNEIDRLTDTLIGKLYSTNPRFNASKFIAACQKGAA